MKMAVFWDVAPSDVRALMMEAVSTSETSAGIYQATWCNFLVESTVNYIFM
jgi:hypothetical protein